ncbi:MAG: hypothetical protein HQM04_08430 [Magnetococcales bacterium]|nr:hypothetical protein [Magnetococcales bacterium]MBF0115058.1 hypothetical protein [Magnetococcales bacterium]
MKKSGIIISQLLGIFLMAISSTVFSGEPKDHHYRVYRDDTHLCCGKTDTRCTNGGMQFICGQEDVCSSNYDRMSDIEIKEAVDPRGASSHQVGSSNIKNHCR